MADILMVPVHLDALVLGSATAVAGATADFSALPYLSGTTLMNGANPFLGASVAAAPMAAPGLTLPAGTHLHWTLPSALSHATSLNGQLQFPRCPNRWLVTRSTGSGSTATATSWLIESDYLHPAGTAPAGPISTFPPNGAADPEPFHYLGRQSAAAGWAPTSGARYLDRLTAIGWGDPAFAALYGNAPQVFGAHDPATTACAGQTYTVYGWYSDATQCPLVDFLAEIRTGSAPTTSAQIAEEWATLKARFGWEWNGLLNAVPASFICYGQLVLPATALAANPAAMADEASVAVGSNTGEALSAWLTQQVFTELKSSNAALPDTARAAIEDQLEMIRLQIGFNATQLDTARRFRDLRHAQGFSPDLSGLIWSVRPQSAEAPSISPEISAEEAESVTLPDPLAHLLNALNSAQLAYNRARRAVVAARAQVFADWCRYQQATHHAASSPPATGAAAIATLLRGADADRIQTLCQASGLLTLESGPGGSLTAVRAGFDPGVTAPGGASPAPTAAQQVASLLAELDAALAAHNAAVADGNEASGRNDPQYTIQSTGAPRFWRPTNPAILLSGAALPSARYAIGAAVPCLFYSGSMALPGNGPLTDTAGLDAVLAAVASSDRTLAAGFNASTVAPWHPLFLEWEIELLQPPAPPPPPPSGPGGSIADAFGSAMGVPPPPPPPQPPGPVAAYPADFLTANYRFASLGPELQPVASPALVATGRRLTGRSILTEDAGALGQSQLVRYIQDKVLPAATAASAAAIAGARSAALTQFAGVTAPTAPDAGCTALVAYEKLQGVGIASQVLGGINDALLSLTTGTQLPVTDPSSSDANALAAQIAPLIGDYAVAAPSDGLGFNPIRNGAFRFTGLRIVDCFGQILTLKLPAAGKPVLTSSALQTSAGAACFALPPRLVQPTRIDLRWLSAVNGEIEMNSHPATAPVCGWLLPNYLDESLMVYTADGIALGTISVLADSAWQMAPGGAGARIPDAIPNPYLRRLVSFLVAQAQQATGGRTFIANLMQAIDSSLGNIDPEGAAQHAGLSVMVGRPVALVRASLGLSQKGPTATAQLPDDLAARVGGRPARDAGVGAVNIPVRIGEGGRVGDGVVGYWVESAESYRNNTFYSTAPAPASSTATPAASPGIASAAALALSVDAAPLTLAMLVDPRGKVFATSGVLPTKSIDIPAEQFAKAMQSLKMTFLAAPIISDSGQVALPLRETPGYDWAWLQQGSRLAWTVEPVAPDNPAVMPVGTQVVRDGWLQLSRRFE
ncbi:MAG: hypothetical protein JSS36_08075 [Proteobacteria bacterium]|nr:hypothetical protein [Pseudomonadota bacterium]